MRDTAGTLTILQDIDFTLAPRESAAIVGASGSGKSTLLAHRRRARHADLGHRVGCAASTCSRSTRTPAPRCAPSAVGFVFQSFQLLANLTALENVMLPLELQGRADARAAAREMLDRVGLGERLGHYPKVLSGGEQQRVALARAFVVRPAVLLADEPTGSLDFATGAKVMALMFDLNREAGTTLVLVTHDREHRRALRPAAAHRGGAARRRRRAVAGRGVARAAAAGRAPAPRRCRRRALRRVRGVPRAAPARARKGLGARDGRPGVPCRSPTPGERP